MTLIYLAGNRRAVGIIAFALLLILFGELAVPAHRQSQTFDENTHIFAGYSYWTHGDFGMNPEHPPLVKLLAALPILPLKLKIIPFPDMFFKGAASVGGSQLLYGNNADPILFRARMAVATLSVLLALLVFAAAYELSGAAAALLALVLFVFEPNLLAHGSLVTTDMGASLFFFATVYAFYRYIRRRSAARLVIVCITAGLALASKHSLVLVFPVLALLALDETVWPAGNDHQSRGGRARLALRFVLTLTLIVVAACTILWAFYGFRYQARPAGHTMIPPLAATAPQFENNRERIVLFALARCHVLPEAYLYGWVDVLAGARFKGPYLFGKLYAQPEWFYFPVTFAIKSTIGFLILLIFAFFSIWRRGKSFRQELPFLLIPPAFYLLVAMGSRFNIGIRHILPIYPFLILFIAVAVAPLVQTSRRWMGAIVLLLALHIASSVHAFPNYIPYANEIWGGPNQTYKALTDSNVDWGQQLKDVRGYLDAHDVKDCWFGFFARANVDPRYYGINCGPIPGGFTTLLGIPTGVMRPHVEGTVLLSATELSGEVWGPANLNPLAQFQQLRPDAIIDGGVLVFHGQFDLPLAAAVSHALESSRLLRSGKVEEAHAEAITAVGLAPGDARCQIALGDALASLNRNDEARATFQKALMIVQTVYPEFQDYLLPDLTRKLSGK